MKVTPQNLMLGDWVRAIDGEMLTGPIQVEGITAESIMAGGKVYKADMVQGIELTAARLEKNGFVKMHVVLDKRNFYVLRNMEKGEEVEDDCHCLPGLCLKRLKKGEEVEIIEDDCHGMKTYCYATGMFMPLRYLSDLQHALRMDGKIKEVRP